MKSNSLRKEFFDFFEKKGHKIVPSFSLIPSDPSVLFTTSGMQQFKPYYLDKESPFGKITASCQKCLRTSDIDDVGDDSHLTFFEMLGNFSFNDYFKEETVKLALQFFLENCDLPIDKLWFSYFGGDSEAPEDIESKEILISNNILKERIVPMGREDNFWGPTGTEGPCGPTIDIYFELKDNPCEKGEKCVFGCNCGRFVELWSLVFNEYYQDANKKVFPIEDKGGKKGIDTGLGLERLAAASQGKETIFETDLFESLINIIGNDKKIEEVRIIADHIKGSCFLISEGIMPSKVDKGYVLRRLLRKAIRCKKSIDGGESLLTDVAEKVIEIYKDIYPELESKKQDILTVIQKEEDTFFSSIKAGRKEYDKLTELTGKAIFNLYSTHSVPLEVSLSWAKDDSKEVKNIEDFYKLQEEHKKISRVGAEKKFGGLGKEDQNEQAIKLHTATHLLHAALRKILTDSLKQMGSNITSERLRFDFSFDRKLTDQEVADIEDLINGKIRENLEIKKEELELDEAIQDGALSFFKEKYPNRVSVYSINDFSKEICAGPHANKTGHLGRFKIIKQESIGSGIRRIKAILN
ncbi:MAG: alanine--tRNA ligase [Patescibacteria group bacterium]|nr:alanine--tRNA ligase [Patescibacteria group bacterium]